MVLVAPTKRTVAPVVVTTAKPGNEKKNLLAQRCICALLPQVVQIVGS